MPCAFKIKTEYFCQPELIRVHTQHSTENLNLKQFKDFKDAEGQVPQERRKKKFFHAHKKYSDCFGCNRLLTVEIAICFKHFRWLFRKPICPLTCHHCSDINPAPSGDSYHICSFIPRARVIRLSWNVCDTMPKSSIKALALLPYFFNCFNKPVITGTTHRNPWHTHENFQKRKCPVHRTGMELATLNLCFAEVIPNTTFEQHQAANLYFYVFPRKAERSPNFTENLFNPIQLLWQ